MTCDGLFYSLSMKQVWGAISNLVEKWLNAASKGRYRAKECGLIQDSLGRPYHERVRRQVFGRRFPGVDVGPGTYVIQGKEYGYLEIRQILHALIEQKPAKQYADEYERLLLSLNTKQFQVADYSYIINLGNRLGVTPAPYMISKPDNSAIQKH